MSTRLILISVLAIACTPIALKAQGSDSKQKYEKMTANLSLNYTPIEASYFDQLIDTDIPYGQLRSTYMGASSSYFYQRLYCSVGLLAGEGKKNKTDTLISRARQNHLFVNLGLSPIVQKKFVLSIYAGVRHIRLLHYTDKPEQFGFLNGIIETPHIRCKTPASHCRQVYMPA